MASITTIIPTYRRPLLLKRAVRSVLAQSYPDFQVCVYDNASGDETREVVEELARHDDRVKYYCHERNIGMLPNFVFGLSRVESPFFSILSDDDILFPNFFETAIGAFENYPEAKWFSGFLIGADEDGKVLRLNARHGSESVLSPVGIFGYMVRNWHTWTAMLFKTEVLASAGGLDPEVGPDADVDFVLRVAAVHPAVASPVPCAIAMDHPGSAQRTKARTFDVAGGLRRIVRNVTAILSSQKVDEAARHAMMAALGEWVFKSGLVYVLGGEKGAAVAASEALGGTLGAPARAAMLKQMTRDSMAGAVARGALSDLWKLRRVLRNQWRPGVASRGDCQAGLDAGSGLGDDRQAIRASVGGECVTRRGCRV